MLASLKKNGLSSIMQELKSQKYAKSASRAERKEQSHISQRQGKVNDVSKFDMGTSDIKSPEKLVLDAMIDILSFKQHEACLIGQHDYNPTKYLCLQANCQQKIGCCYCFLQKHKSHSKIQVKMCLKDLTELKQKVKQSRCELVQHLQHKREEIYQKMRRQLSQIRQKFLNDLDFLSNKIEEQIERQFTFKLERLSNFNISQKPKNISLPHNITFRKQQFQESKKSNRQQLSFSQIAQIFNSKPSVDKFSLGQSKVSEKMRPREARGASDSFIFGLNKEEAAKLLDQLGKLNLTIVEQYLKNELLEAKEFAQYLKVFQGFYSELGSSLDEFLASFKRAVPGFKSFENSMTEPDVLKFISL